LLGPQDPLTADLESADPEQNSRELEQQAKGALTTGLSEVAVTGCWESRLNPSIECISCHQLSSKMKSTELLLFSSNLQRAALAKEQRHRRRLATAIELWN
jgi:hypothetical protein